MGDAFRGEGSDGAGEFLHDAGDGNAEDSLAAGEEVDNFFVAAAFVDGGAIADQGDGCEVVDAEVAKVADRKSNVLEGNAGIEQSLNDHQHQEVAERVQALGA